MKRCGKCGRELPESEFYRKEKSPDGLQAYCKSCQTLNNRKKQKIGGGGGIPTSQDSLLANSLKS